MSPRTTSPPRVELMGVGIDPLSEQETIETAVGGVARGDGGWVCPINLDVLRQAVEHDEVRRLVDAADVRVADGMPLLWASRLAGRPVPERVAGSSLIWGLTAASARRGLRVFLLGGNPGAAEAAAAVLAERNPGLSVVGTMCPPMGFERDPEQLTAIERALAERRPDIVFVGLGFPKQEKLIQRLRPVLPAAWFLSCGVSFSFVSGEVRRAPAWVQRLGFEWLHRLVQEPKRLFRRYVLDGLPFLLRLLASAALSRR